MGESQKALEYFNQALPIRRAVGDRSGEANTLNNIGGVYSTLDENQKALDFYNQALPLRRAVGDRSGEAVTLHNLSLAFRAMGSFDTAIWLGKQAVNVLQSIRRDNRALSGELKSSYEKSIESAYRDLTSLLVQQKRFAEAEEVLNLLKERETADFIRRDGVADRLKAATLSEREQQALADYEQLIGQIIPIGQRKAALLAKMAREPLGEADRRQADQIDHDLASANTTLFRFLSVLEKSFAPTSALTKPDTRSPRSGRRAGRPTKARPRCGRDLYARVAGSVHRHASDQRSAPDLFDKYSGNGAECQDLCLPTAVAGPTLGSSAASARVIPDRVPRGSAQGPRCGKRRLIEISSKLSTTSSIHSQLAKIRSWKVRT
jgi:hypothetical protein